MIAFIFVFFSSWKTIFKLSQQLLDTSQQLGYLLIFFSYFLSHSRQLLDSYLIHWDTFWLLNSSLTANSIHRAPLLWKPLDSSSIASSIAISRAFLFSTALDSSRSVENYDFLYVGSLGFQIISPRSLSIIFDLSTSQTSLSLIEIHFPTQSLVSRSTPLSGMILFHPLIMHFISFDLKFGVFEKFWDFSNLLRFLQNFWDGFVFKWCQIIIHCISRAF